MTRILGRMLLALVALLQPLTVSAGFAAGTAGLRAGAARVDITPALADLPKPFTTINDRLYVRVLVLESGGMRAVLVVGDLPTIASDVLADLTKKVAVAAGAPVANVMVAVTHTHNAVRLDNNPVGIILPGSAKITAMTSDIIIAAVKQATAGLQPARAGYTTGTFRLAAPRMESGVPDQAPRALDRAMGVFKVESATGETIALLVNNGPEPVMAMQMPTAVSADVAGAMERYVEQRFNDKAVVLYTVGSPPGVAINARQRVPGTTPADPLALINAVGTVLGEEVISASARVKTSDVVRIAGVIDVLTCPGKATTPLNNPSQCSDAPGATLPRCVFTDRDTAPVALKMGTIQLGDMVLVHSDANILPGVWSQVRDGAPAPANTILVSLGYGPMHYVVPDADYPSNSYPVTASMVKQGCAERGFVTGALKMIHQTEGK